MVGIGVSLLANPDLISFAGKPELESSLTWNFFIRSLYETSALVTLTNNIWFPDRTKDSGPSHISQETLLILNSFWYVRPKCTWNLDFFVLILKCNKVVASFSSSSLSISISWCFDLNTCAVLSYQQLYSSVSWQLGWNLHLLYSLDQSDWTCVHPWVDPVFPMLPISQFSSPPRHVELVWIPSKPQKNIQMLEHTLTVRREVL